MSYRTFFGQGTARHPFPALFGVVVTGLGLGLGLDCLAGGPPAGDAPTISLNRNVVLLNDGVSDAAMVQRLAQALSDKFGLPVTIRPNFIDLSAAHRPSRRQYDYSVLLAAVHRRVRGTRGRVVLLTAKDTFGGDLNWSTGIAYCNGTTAVVSACRLNPTFWGEPADQKKWEERVRKILLHELGHTFGRTGHCPNWNCCVHGSNSIADIDRTGRDYCAACGRLARTAVARIKGE